MKKLTAILGFSILVLGLCLTMALAADKGAKEEAVALVNKAVAFLKAHGRDQALAEFNNPKGQFIDRDLYIIVGDMQGKCLAHGAMPELAGKDMTEIRDLDGNYITKERLKLLEKNNTAWQTYKYPNPATKKIETKSMYMERVGDLYIGVGVYQ